MGDWIDEYLDADRLKHTSTRPPPPISCSEEDVELNESPAEKKLPALEPSKPSKVRSLAMNDPECEKMEGASRTGKQQDSRSADMSELERNMENQRLDEELVLSKVRSSSMKERECKDMEATSVKGKQQCARAAKMSKPERKMENQRLVEESDLFNAKNILASDGIPGHNNKPPPAPTFENFKPVTDEDFDKLTAMIGTVLRRRNKDRRRTLRYLTFLKSLVREVTRDLNADDTKDISTFAFDISNEKLAASRKAKGSKSKKTPKKGFVKVDEAVGMDLKGRKTSKKSFVKEDEAGGMDDTSFNDDKLDGFMKKR